MNSNTHYFLLPLFVLSIFIVLLIATKPLYYKAESLFMLHRIQVFFSPEHVTLYQKKLKKRVVNKNKMTSTALEYQMTTKQKRLKFRHIYFKNSRTLQTVLFGVVITSCLCKAHTLADRSAEAWTLKKSDKNDASLSKHS